LKRRWLLEGHLTSARRTASLREAERREIQAWSPLRRSTSSVVRAARGRGYVLTPEAAAPLQTVKDT
jgi:hypothetical protein